MNNATNHEAEHYFGIQDGEVFTIAGIEFIKFPSINGETPIVAKDIVFNSRFGSDNDFRESDVLKRLKAEILPKIIEAVGKENLCTVKTDLTTWDGIKSYGVMESLISIPTMDFCRENVDIFDKHKVKSWWWLATAESALPHCDPWWTLCVSPPGYIYFGNYGYDYGVRPFLILKSSIFESFEA